MILGSLELHFNDYSEISVPITLHPLTGVGISLGAGEGHLGIAQDLLWGVLGRNQRWWKKGIKVVWREQGIMGSVTCKQGLVSVPVCPCPMFDWCSLSWLLTKPYFKLISQVRKSVHRCLCLSDNPWLGPQIIEAWVLVVSTTGVSVGMRVWVCWERCYWKRWQACATQIAA